MLLTTLLYIVFILSSIVLVTVILLQEGKGGGFGEALGGHGQATFGVGTSGINRFTGWVAVVFLVTALGIHVLNRRATTSSVLEGGGSMLNAPAETAPDAGGTGNE